MPLKRKVQTEKPLNKRELDKFKKVLLQYREDVATRIRDRASTARVDDAQQLTEEIDQAAHATEEAFNMRLLDKEVKLLQQIEGALRKFEDGTYGVCEGTGEAIGRARLEARPWTRYSVSYKEQLEREKKGRVSR